MILHSSMSLFLSRPFTSDTCCLYWGNSVWHESRGESALIVSIGQTTGTCPEQWALTRHCHKILGNDTCQPTYLVPIARLYISRPDLRASVWWWWCGSTHHYGLGTGPDRAEESSCLLSKFDHAWSWLQQPAFSENTATSNSAHDKGKPWRKIIHKPENCHIGIGKLVTKILLLRKKHL